MGRGGEGRSRKRWWFGLNGVESSCGGAVGSNAGEGHAWDGQMEGMRQDEQRMSGGFSIMPLRMESSGCSRTVVSSEMDSWEKGKQVRNKNRATRFSF